VFTIRATKKLLDRCGGPSASDAPTTTVLGDWYGTALFWRPQVALFVNEQTRLPVLVPLAPVASIVSRFVDDVARVFAALGLDPRFVDTEVTEMSEHLLAKTASRSVIGTMNDFTFLASVHRDQGHADDLMALSLQLAQTPCGPLSASTGFPDLEVRAMVERVPGLFGKQT
jgi:hypothetical protein